MLTCSISVASLERSSKSSENKEGVRSSGSSMKALKYRNGLHKIPKSQHFGYPSSEQNCCCLSLLKFLLLSNTSHSSSTFLLVSYLSRLQRSTREEHRRRGLCVKCLVAQLGGKTHVSSSSALNSIIKCHSDTRDGPKVCATRS